MTLPRDNNNVTPLSGVLDTDGVTVRPVKATPSNHAFNCIDGTTGSTPASTTAHRDDNSVPTMIVISSADGISPVCLAVDSNGKLLIQST